MPVIPTFDELYELAKAEIRSRRPRLTDWNAGSVLDATTGGQTILADESIRYSAARFATLFFDTATGADLDALALDRLGLIRKPATAAVGEIEWTRDASGAYTILAGTQMRAVVGSEIVTVQSTAAVSMLSTDTTVIVPVQATVTGRATNAAADTVTEVVTPIIADPDATITNPQPLAGGSDAETDEAFRDRIRRYYASLRRGTIGSLETGARSVPGVSIVTVDESEVESSGWVYLYIGDPDARSNDVLAAAVAAEIVNWRAAGVLVEVLGSEREEKDLEISVVVEKGTDQTAVGDAIRAAIVAYGDTLGPKEEVQPSRIQKACHDASDLVVGARLDAIEDDDYAPASPENAIRFVEERIRLAFTEVEA